MILDGRAALEALLKERRVGYSAISQLIGKNSAYIQQFIKRGTPRKLDEDDRRTIAEFFGVDEAILGAPTTPLKSGTGLSSWPLIVPRMEIDASAGPGGHVDFESSLSGVAFQDRWLRRISRNPDQLSVIQVAGDSMTPTLCDRDEIMVDNGDAANGLRDGIYVLRFDDALMVKRLAVNPATRRISIMSDNSAYPGWPDCDPDLIQIIGRVIWVGRTL